MRFLILSIIPAIAFMAINANAATIKPNKTVMATVNGKKITASDVTIRLWGENGIKALNEIIVEKAMLDEAAKQGITTDSATVDNIYKNSLGNRTPEEAAKDLAKIGWTEKDVKERIKNQIITTNLIIKLGKINITDEDMQKTYEGNKSQFMTKETYNISQITTATKEEAEAILDSLLKDHNADFGAVSAEKSNIPELRAAKGLIGDVERGRLPKEIEDEVFALRPGQISKIIPIGNIYTIFKVNNINPARQLSLDEIKDSLRNMMLNQLINSKRNEVINDVLKRSNIQIN